MTTIKEIPDLTKLTRKNCCVRLPEVYQQKLETLIPKEEKPDFLRAAIMDAIDAFEERI